MNEREFKERVARLTKIGEVVEKLPVEIRADAFDLLKPYVEEGGGERPTSQHRGHSKQDQQDDLGDEDEGAFFAMFDHDKPADNARLIAASFYRLYGTTPFSIEEVENKAKAVGLTVPDRIDMTFAAAQANGKKLFARAGRGMFKPTVHGEAYLKQTYSVKKGTRQRPAANNE